MMDTHALCALLEASPVIAAVTEERFKAAVESPAAVLFHLRANLLHIKAQIDEAHKAGKCILVHLDLAEGIGKDRVGIDYLRQCGVDGILTTRGQLVRQAKELGLEHTHFANPHGLHNPDHYTTAKDIYVMELKLTKNGGIKSAAQQIKANGYTEPFLADKRDVTALAVELDDMGKGLVELVKVDCYE